MAGGSYFKEWGSLGPKTTQPRSVYGNDISAPLIGQVLDIYYTPSRNTNAAPGLIKVKIFSFNSSKTDEEVTTMAHPADLSIIKYPLPGELVLLTMALKEDLALNRITKTFYYTTVLAAAKSVTYNSKPYYFEYKADTSTSVVNILNAIFKSDSPARRFEVKLQDVSRFMKKSTVMERAILRPYEGDFIIQSRFGSSLRLGSTTSDDNQWSKVGGVIGSPITIFSIKTDIHNPLNDTKKLPTAQEQAGGDLRGVSFGTATAVLTQDAFRELFSNTKKERLTQKKLTVEDINSDAATFALCSKQRIEVKMATSRELLSYKYSYNISKQPIQALENQEPTFLPMTVRPPTMKVTGARPIGQINSGGGIDSNLGNSGGVFAGNYQEGGGIDIKELFKDDPAKLADKNTARNLDYYSENQFGPVTREHICVGDSQTPYVSRNTTKAEIIGPPGVPNLHHGGETVKWLISAVKTRAISPLVKTVVVVIGTNGRFSKYDKVETLVPTMLERFPNARFLIVQGGYGWGYRNGQAVNLFMTDKPGLTDAQREVEDLKIVQTYYARFTAAFKAAGKADRCIIVEPGIGKPTMKKKDANGQLYDQVEVHQNHPIYEEIGKKLDSLIV